MASRVESKRCILEVAKNVPMLQNTIVNLTDNAFFTDNQVFGVQMPGLGVDQLGSRVGSEIYAKGMQVSVCIESQQYRPQATYWLYLIKNVQDPSQDINAKGLMFEGRSTLIPMDYIDTSKVKILFAKKFVLKAPNMGTALPASTGAGLGQPPGTFEVNGEYPGELVDYDWRVMTNPQRIEKFYIPLKRKIKYRNEQDALIRVQPIGTDRYQWVAVAYDNYASNIEGGATPASVGLYPVGHISLTTNLIFTDQ